MQRARYSLAPSLAQFSAAPSLGPRLAEKQQELANLQQLQQLSASLVTELETLQQKLATLADGTEAVSLVMNNWNNVIKALTLASTGLQRYQEHDYNNEDSPPLPETLVRIRI